MGRLIVLCATCNTPGSVVFDEKGDIENAFFVCKCPRPSIEEVNEKEEDV